MDLEEILHAFRLARRVIVMRDSTSLRMSHAAAEALNESTLEAPDLTALDLATTHEAASVIKQAIHQRALCAACGAGGASMRCVKCECVCYCSATCQQAVCKCIRSKYVGQWS